MLKDGKEAIEYLRKTVNPKHIVVMHVWSNAYSEWIKKVEELKAFFPKLWFPTMELESKTLK